MRKTTATVSQCRNAVSSLLGKKVTIRQNRGRNKIMTFCGIVSEVYDGIFVVKTAHSVAGRMTFSYQDMLCGEIRLKPHGDSSEA